MPVRAWSCSCFLYFAMRLLGDTFVCKDYGFDICVRIFAVASVIDTLSALGHAFETLQHATAELSTSLISSTVISRRTMLQLLRISEYHCVIASGLSVRHSFSVTSGPLRRPGKRGVFLCPEGVYSICTSESMPLTARQNIVPMSGIVTRNGKFCIPLPCSKFMACIFVK